jgi:hypothetical protein
MVVNFRTREISRGVRKLARTPTLNKKKNTTSKLRNIINLGTKNRKIPKLKGSEKSKKRKGDLHVLATR